MFGRLAALLSPFLLAGCITFWERDESGIYPRHLGYNGSQYFMGWKQPLPAERSR
jgi:hypothetical protein